MDYTQELVFAQAILNEIAPEDQQVEKTILKWNEPSRAVIEKEFSSWIQATAPYKELRITDETLDSDCFFIALHELNAYSNREKKAIPTLRLFSIWIPEELRRQGLASFLIEKLEEHAKQRQLQFLVGPVLEESMALLLIKRKYMRRTILDYVY